MIAFISGTVAKKEPKSVLLEVGGIGYRVFCPLEVIARVEEGKSATLHTYHHIREEENSLFGFLEEENLRFFEKLISVSGIGPRTALEILEVPAHLIREAIVSGDVDFLKSLKGIGKKTAERVILELRGGLPDEVSANSPKVPGEVIDALCELGFDRAGIQKKFLEIDIALETPEEMVKWFLQKAHRAV